MAKTTTPGRPASASVLMNRLLASGKFRHVQVLLRLAELGSLQRTAQAVGVSQSAVTQSLAYLEELLESRLFERHARGVRPTRACLALLPAARQLMSGVSQGAESIAALNQRGREVIRLTASAAATTGLILQMLPGFHDRYPDIDVVLMDADGEALLLSVANGEADLVACRRPAVVPEGWTFHSLLQDQLVVVAAKNHPLALRRKLGWGSLADQTWVLPPAGSIARSEFDALLSQLPFEPRVYPLLTRTTVAMWWVLRKRAALAFVPLSTVIHLIEIGDLAVLRVGEPQPMEPLGVLARTDEIGRSVILLLEHLHVR